MNQWVRNRGLVAATLSLGTWGCGSYDGAAEQRAAEQSSQAEEARLGTSRNALNATGSGVDYVGQCQAHGVPIPNAWSSTSVLPNGSYDLAKWTKGGDFTLANALTGFGDGKVYTFISEATGREGQCVIAAHYGRSTAMDMICQGKSGYACFWEKNNTPADPPVPPAPAIGAATMDGGTALTSHATCTACHLGANAFIAHKGIAGDGLNSDEDLNHTHKYWKLPTGTWYTPIVPSSFPDNAQQSIDGYPSSCTASCHAIGSSIAGAFPPLRDAALGNDNYCLLLKNIVNRPASMGGMPPNTPCTSEGAANCPAQSDPQVQQMLATCGNPTVPDVAVSYKGSPVAMVGYGNSSPYGGLWDHVLAGSDIYNVPKMYLNNNLWTNNAMNGWSGPQDYSSTLKSYYRASMLAKDGDGSKLSMFSTDYNGQIWELQQGPGAATRTVNSTVMAAGSPNAYRRFDGYNIVVYRGVDNRIYESYWNGSAWTTNRLASPGTDISLPATGDPIGYNRGSTASVIYKCSNLICEFRLIGGTWQFRTIWPQVPLKGSTLPVPVKRSSPGPADYMIFYVAEEGLHVINDPIEPNFGSTSDGWAGSDHTIVSSPAPYNSQDGGTRVAYLSDNGTSLKEAALPFGSTPNVGPWTVTTRVTTTSNEASLVGDPAALVDAMARSTIFFRNQSGTIYQLQTVGAGTPDTYTKTTVQKGYNILTSGSVAANAQQSWDLYLAPGTYKFDVSPSSGDPDLYVKKNGTATTSSYDCRPYSPGLTFETCTVTLPGPNYTSVNVMVRGYNATSGFSIQGYYNQ